MPPAGLSDHRDELASHLATAFRATAGDRIGPEPAAEAARAVVLGGPLPAAFTTALGDEPACAFVSFDADQIHRWAFASERVQVAKGASQTLEFLNLHVPWMVREVPGLHGVIYSAGGGGLLVASGAADPAALQAAVRGWLERASHELTFTVLVERLAGRDLQPSAPPRPLGPGGLAALDRFELVDGLRGALARLQVRQREEKEARSRSGGPQVRWEIRPGTASERCPSCGRRPRGAAPSPEDGPDAWCAWCRTLREACLSHAHARQEPFFRNGRQLTFSDLAQASNRRRQYLGFVAIDGNGMGSVVQGLQNLLQLRIFSVETTRIYEAARGRIEAVLGQGFLASGWRPEEASLSLLSGGDEVACVLPAAAGLASFETLLAEAAAAERAGVPGAALHRLVGQAREEDAGLRSLAPGRGREEVLALLAANFFRYQLARNRELAAWWQAIAPAPAAPADPVTAWFRASGVRRIERLVELLSLEPIPEAAS